MRLIDDVREDLRTLGRDRKTLRNFGLLVGGVFLLLGLVGAWRGHFAPGWLIVAALGAILILLGLAVPASLRWPHRSWMAAAFALGWFVSRLVLLLLFYGVMTPVAVAARLAGKRFLDVRFREGRESYWVPRGGKKQTGYERMI